MKILVLTPIWKRPEIVRVFLDKFNDLDKIVSYELMLYPILSYDDIYNAQIFNMLTDDGHLWMSQTPNNPLGQKKNIGLCDAMSDINFDYLMELGSDDILKPEVFDYYTPYMERGELMFGMKDLYVCEPKTKRCILAGGRWNDGMAFGAGRMIHRRVIEKVGKLWEDKSECGLDTESAGRINKAYGRPAHDPLCQIVPMDKPMVLSIKTDTNLWGMGWFDHFRAKTPDSFKDVDYETITKEFRVWESLR